jgi:hypothetical protein
MIFPLVVLSGGLQAGIGKMKYAMTAVVAVATLRVRVTAIASLRALAG